MDETGQTESSPQAELSTVDSLIGVVIVPPKLWSKQKFYLADPEQPAGELVEIYNYYGRFPELRPGDVIAVDNYNVSSLTTGERYKISAAEQIRLLGHEDLPWPETLNLADVSEDLLNQLIAVQAKIKKINKASLTIADEDGNSLAIYLGSDWQWPTGQLLAKDLGILVRGVLVKSGQTLRLRPITSADIKLEIKVENQEIKAPASAAQATSTMALDFSSEETKKFLYVLSPAALAGLGWAVYKFVVGRI